MSESLLQRFIELIKYDQHINALEKDIEKLQTDVDRYEEEIYTLKENLEATERHKRDMHKFVDAQELRMKEFDQQERDYKQRLERVNSGKEFASLQREIVALQQEQAAFEKELLDAWKKYEDAQRAAEEKKAYVETHVQKFDALVYEDMQKINNLKERITQLSAERPAKTENIAPEMLEKYSVMRSQITNPVVPLDRGSCSACFNTVPQQEVLSIERGAFKQCRMCFRFLYSDR